MRLYIDETCLNMDIARASKRVQDWYKANKHYGYTLETEKGKIDFSPKSVARIALKVAMTPIAVPALKMIYKMRNKEPRRHEKHEDLLDYFVLTMIEFISLFDEDILYVKTVERPDSNERTVVSLIAIVPGQTIEGTTTKEIEASDSRGSSYVRGGENGHGENETNQGDNQQESAGTALAKRISP